MFVDRLAAPRSSRLPSPWTTSTLKSSPCFAGTRACPWRLSRRSSESRATVQNRLAKLEREGVIAGYALRLKPQVDGQTIRALMTIASEGDQATFADLRRPRIPLWEQRLARKV
jgi:hypothetical protein